MKKAVKIVIDGTVQGVFFRQFIKTEADKLSVKGLTRNLENGNVEVIAEGDKEALEKLIEICKKGPQFAQIRSLKVEERKYSGDFKEFKVLKF
jgi:acylphosphatase